MLGQDYRIKEIFESKRNMSVTAFTRQLLGIFPKMKLREARAIAMGTPRIKARSKYDPHYGEQAAKRNFRHAQNVTHGLYFFNNEIRFS